MHTKKEAQDGGILYETKAAFKYRAFAFFRADGDASQVWYAGAGVTLHFEG